MSQAFIKEREELWLHDVSPTLYALTMYLTQENNGIRVYEKEVYKYSKDNRVVHHMSNGLSYAIGDDSKWFIVD